MSKETNIPRSDENYTPSNPIPNSTTPRRINFVAIENFPKEIKGKDASSFNKNTSLIHLAMNKALLKPGRMDLSNVNNIEKSVDHRKREFDSEHHNKSMTSTLKHMEREK